MHVCKFKKRNTRFVGHSITVKACTSCHEVDRKYIIETEDETFVLPKGAVLPHIQRERDDLTNLRRAVIKGKEMAKKGGLLIVLKNKLARVSDVELERMLAQNMRFV